MAPKVILLNDLRYQLHVRYLGPYSLASELNARGIPTMVINWFTSKPDFFEYLEQFITNDCLALGISSTFLFAKDIHQDPKNLRLRSKGMELYTKSHLHFSDESQLLDWSFRLKDLLKRKAPNASLILGGAKTYLLNPTLRSHSTSPYRHFDYFFLGAANFSFPTFVEDRMQKKESPCNSVNGFNIISASPHDNYPAQVKWSPTMGVARNEALPFEVARGCAFNCKFCNFEKLRSQFKNSEQIKQELLDNYEQFGTQNYLFVDDCINDSEAKIGQLCTAIESLPFKIQWTSYARVDPIIKSPKTFDRMVRSGCRGIHLGIETFNAEAARLAGKPLPPAKVKETLLSLKSTYGRELLIEASFITGLPKETVESQLATIAWIKENPVLDFFSVSALNVLEFDNTIDGTVIHFSDHSKNPEKYGFSQIEYRPPYWKHATMDSITANELAKVFLESITSVRPSNSNIWQYPLIRSLGYTHEDFLSFNEAPNAREQYQSLNNSYFTVQNNHWKELADFWRCGHREEIAARRDCFIYD